MIGCIRQVSVVDKHADTHHSRNHKKPDASRPPRSPEQTREDTGDKTHEPKAVGVIDPKQGDQKWWYGHGGKHFLPNRGSRKRRFLPAVR